MNKKHFDKALKTLLANHAVATATDWQTSDTAIQSRLQSASDAVHGFDFFINTYFPHVVMHPTRSVLHEYLFTELPKITHEPTSALMAIAAPRGEAKSTIVSKLYTLYRIVMNISHYIIIIMDSTDQAYSIIDFIKNELEFNPRLASDFPKVAGQGRRWQVGSIITKNNIKVEAVGAGKKLRGRSHGTYRPDLVILDDIENDENVRSPTQRDKLHDWLSKSVLGLTGVGVKMDVLYIGTILHHDSVLNRTLNTAGWRTRKFKALMQMPDNMALWDEWESIFLSSKDQDGNSPQADAFYEAHKDEMDKGAIRSWLARPLLDLMKIRARNGHSAFDSEYQNDPTAGDDAPFAHAIHYWSVLPDKLIYFGACDPSLGKKGQGRDPSAIIIVGLDRQTGKVYCINADIKKRVPDKIISDVIAYQKQYKCVRWAVESVQFQEFFRTELIKRGGQAGISIPAQAVIPHTDKLLRIESLQPHMDNQMLTLHPLTNHPHRPASPFSKGRP